MTELISNLIAIVLGINISLEILKNTIKSLVRFAGFLPTSYRFGEANEDVTNCTRREEGGGDGTGRHRKSS